MLKTGQIVITKGIQHKTVSDTDFAQFVGNSLTRHMCEDWGNVCSEDKEANNAAVTNGDRVISAYENDGEKILIITEADRSSTTVLFPTEY